MNHATTRNVWDAVSRMAAAGERPSIPRIMAATGINSRSWVTRHVEALEDEGYISLGPKHSKVRYGCWCPW
jgi:SOS-response transcriptional repressor LexA